MRDGISPFQLNTGIPLCNGSRRRFPVRRMVGVVPRARPVSPGLRGRRRARHAGQRSSRRGPADGRQHAPRPRRGRKIAIWPALRFALPATGWFGRWFNAGAFVVAGASALALLGLSVPLAGSQFAAKDVGIGMAAVVFFFASNVAIYIVTRPFHGTDYARTGVLEFSAPGALSRWLRLFRNANNDGKGLGGSLSAHVAGDESCACSSCCKWVQNSAGLFSILDVVLCLIALPCAFVFATYTPLVTLGAAFWTTSYLALISALYVASVLAISVILSTSRSLLYGNIAYTTLEQHGPLSRCRRQRRASSGAQVLALRAAALPLCGHVPLQAQTGKHSLFEAVWTRGGAGHDLVCCAFRGGRRMPHCLAARNPRPRRLLLHHQRHHPCLPQRPHRCRGGRVPRRAARAPRAAAPHRRWRDGLRNRAAHRRHLVLPRDLAPPR
ncbi:hypothetical protein DFJ74DRAFT_312362 [Hyaloraphidium curvatum]|nr:hypothetical protein DFJ74DRAFT_312362 [Hyaloraphidium curvatum]